MLFLGVQYSLYLFGWFVWLLLCTRALPEASSRCAAFGKIQV